MTAVPSFIQPRSSLEQKSITFAAKIFLFVLAIVILEGAVRKWISADFTTPLVLLRDILALWGVTHAINTRKLRLNTKAGVLLMVWTVMVIGWSLLQAILNEISIEILAIGLRFWLLYLWFSIAIALSITEEDFRFTMHSILATMFCMVPLVILQYLQPPEAFINKQVSDVENELIFTVIFGVVRTTGTFSFTLGFTTFLAIVTPFALAYFTSKTTDRKDKYWKALSMSAMLIGTMVSGSRTAFVNFFVALFVYFIYLFFITRVRLKFRVYVSMIFGVILIAALAITFSGALSAIEERAEGATESENVPLRMAEMFIGTSALRENFDVIGSGIGYGANFAGVVLSGERAFLNGETELERTLFSGGMLGLFFVGAKMLLAGWGIFRSIGISRNGSVLPLLLWFASAIGLLAWALTGQLTANAMGFMLLGLAIAAMRFPSVGAMR